MVGEICGACHGASVKSVIRKAKKITLEFGGSKVIFLIF